MRYDLHIHTRYSSCSNLEPKKIIEQANKKRLDGIAITDHNTIKGALEVKKLNDKIDKRYKNNLKVIIGEEIMTDKGEILAYYLKKEIKPGKFEDVLKEIKKQNGIAVIAHPYSIGIIGRKNAKEDIFNDLDGIETINSRAFFNFENKKAIRKAKKLDLPQTAGSDAHFKFEIGRAYTEFEGDLKKALKENKTIPKGKNYFSLFPRTLSFINKFLPFNIIYL